MKQILPLLIFCFTLGTLTSKAQTSIQWGKHDTVIYGNAWTSDDLPAYVPVKNTSSVDKDYVLKRIDAFGYNALTDSNAICWGVCFPTDVSVSPISITIKAGETNQNDFVGHVYPDMDGVAMMGSITYRLWDKNDTTDFKDIRIWYNVSPSFSVEEIVEDYSINVFPNPATDIITVDYDLDANENGSFEILNLVGNKVYSQNLDGNDGSVEVSVKSFASGIYFYVLKNKGEVLTTRKMVVR